VYDHLLLLTVVLQGITLLRTLRRADGDRRGYAIVVGGVLVLAVVSLTRDDRFLGSVAIGMSVLTVVLPWVLESVSRWAFARGRLSLAVRMAALRGILMPGSGLARQQQILDGIGLLEREGVDVALDYFRGLAHETEDGSELALIHEQIVSMLFYGQRWDEGIAHYERRFHPGYAAMRPGLALGLLRAYGESGRMDNAAGLLRALEEGPIGADPRSAEMLGQARITFLAYAGEAGVLDEVITEDRVGELGMTPATGALFHGIALARAGDPQRAEAALRRVESLAGPQDQRVLEASRTTLDHVADWTLELEPELSSYVQGVAQRVRRFTLAAKRAKRAGTSLASYGILVGLGIAFGISLLRDAGGIGLLQMGALSPELWATGGWPRLFTAPWLHGDIITLLFDAYSIWLGGPVIEHAYGSARTAAIAIGGAIAGLLAGVVLTPYAGMVMVAGNLMAVAVIVAAMWTLLPSRSPAMTHRSRRSIGITLVLLFVANLLASLPAFLGLDYPPIALLAAGAWGTALSIGLPVSLPRFLERVFQGVMLLVLVATGFGVAMTFQTDAESSLVANRERECEFSSVKVSVPTTFEWIKAEESRTGYALPVFDGMTDELALRAGNLVQLVVVDAWPEDKPALLGGTPELERRFSFTAVPTLPEGWEEPPADQTLRAWEVRQNGVVVGSLVERRLEVQGAPRGVTLIGSPAVALTHTPRLYGALLSDAAAEADSDGKRCHRVGTGTP
jgi:membrane associated rhomboid family serine protease